MKKEYAIGVDIGGTHISAAVVNMNSGEFIHSTVSNSPVDNHASANEIFEIWGSTILKSIEFVGFESIMGIGLAMPGPFDYVNGISLFNGKTKKFENMYGFNVTSILKEFLNLPEDFPVRFINDAAAFAIGEAWVGKASRVRRSLAITLGTGLGSGFIEDGLPIFSGNKVPKDGFIWHLSYKGGVADDYFSTRGLVNSYFELKGRHIGGVKEIVNEAETDEEIRSMFKNFGNNLAKLLTPWIKKFSVEMIVVGGNISKAFSLFGNSMQKQLSDNGLQISIESSELNDIAQMIGAAKIIDDIYWQKLLPELKKQKT